MKGGGLMAAPAPLCVTVVVVVVSCWAARGQTVHNVGGAVGWTTQLPNATYYADWASRQTFLVGDTIVFNFTAGRHDVVRVPQTSYNNCTGDGALGSPNTTTPVSIILDSAGARYYICTFRNGTHCRQGQRLSFTVNATNSSGNVPPSAESPPIPSSRPGSGAASLTGSFLLALLSTGMAVVVI